MRNPLRTEAEAFRFLLVAIVGAAVIVAAAYANEWLGVAAAVLVVGGIGVWLWNGPPAVPPPRPEPLAPPEPSGRYRILLLAPPDAALERGVRERLLARADGRSAEALVVVPALATPVETISGQVDERRLQAQRAADALAATLRSDGLAARGAVGADEPLLAAEDALREFGADEVVFAGDEDLLERARERLAVPVSLLG